MLCWYLEENAIISGLSLQFRITLSIIYYMSILLLLLALTLTIQQECSTLSINAIIPCQMYFTFSQTLQTCTFTSCYTQSPGNPLNQTEWQTCYIQCCPSFVIPNDPTYSNVLPCYTKFSSTPIFVWGLGVIIGSIICILYIFLPCCLDPRCSFYKLRVNLCRRQRHKQANSLQHFQSERGEQRSKREQRYLVSQPQKKNRNKNQSYELNSFLHICMICKQPRPDCRLACGHFYHSQCLIQINNEKLCCKACRKIVKFPVYNYCRFCFTNYEMKYSMQELAYEFTCFSCLLV